MASNQMVILLHVVSVFWISDFMIIIMYNYVPDDVSDDDESTRRVDVYYPKSEFLDPV